MRSISARLTPAYAPVVDPKLFAQTPMPAEGADQQREPAMQTNSATQARRAPVRRITVPSPDTLEISDALTALVADMFALFLKTKNFHWHVSGPHFREYHLMLDEQATEIFAAIDVVAERSRTIGGTTLRSIGHVARIQRVLDNDREHVAARDMLVELRADNEQLTGSLRATHALCARSGDVASISLIETLIDEAERRHWSLDETMREAS